MSPQPEAPRHAFRVTRSAGRTGPPLTETQLRTLRALVHLCPLPGTDADGRAVARVVELRLGSVVVILQSLADKGLVLKYDEDDGCFWAPSITGHARARHQPSAAAMQADRRPASA